MLAVVGARPWNTARVAVDSDGGRRSGIGEVVAVLDALIGRQSPWGVRELAEHTGSTRSSTNRTLLALVDARLARQDDRSQYGVGPRLLVIARALHRTHPLLGLAQTLLDEVRDAHGATATLSISAAASVDSAGDGSARSGRLPTVLVVSEPDAAMRFTAAAGAPLVLGDDATALDAMALAAARGGSAPISIAVPFTIGPSAGGSSTGAEVVVALSTPRTEYSASDLDASLADLERVVARLRAELSASMSGTSTPTAGAEHPASTFVARIDRLITRLATTPFARATTRDVAAAIGAGVAATTSLLATARSTGVLLGDGDGDSAGDGTAGSDISGPGATLLRWAAALGGDATDGRLVLDDLRQLAAQTGETAGFATFDGRTAHVAGTAPGRETVRYVSDGTPEVSLHAGSTGKAILAEAPWLVDEIELEAFTAETITERDALLAELDGIRSRGWALGEGERFHDAFGIAAPVFTDGVVSGSVNVTIPRHRVDRNRIDELAAAVVATAARISALLTTGVR